MIIRLVLVGPQTDRVRFRAELGAGFEVVGEAETVAAARALAVEADAWLVPPPRTRMADREALEEPLTPRELDVLRLMATGLSNRAIAGALGIATETVKFHVASICGKLSAANRTDAVRRAISRGLVPL